MSITLFEHNEMAYRSALTLLHTTGKAAVIHPTGTGKSFIAFKFCEDFPEKHICWLSPSEYIFQTQLENLAAAGGSVPENITFLTYARLMVLSEAEIAGLRPDLIILDEFHRCGAEQWGKGVRALLEAYPGTPLLGLSATNVRYLDNWRDMAAELFDGNVASEITLGEAIARGILQPPKYVLAVYAYRKDLERYEARVRRAGQAVRDRAEEILETLRRHLADADGLDVIFQRHMPDPHGKYLVFCASAEHMDEMIRWVPEWFSQIDPAPHIYRAYSPDPTTRRAFDAFREDKSNHLRLLFTIDMLNEGIHVSGVDGVILFRPTQSPIVYQQQIGRALSVGSSKNPVIFDIVNNIESLSSVGALRREFEDALLTFPIEGGDRERRERFQIIDEVRDCRELFERLNDALTASWDEMYGYAKSYYEAHGDLNVPDRYRTENGRRLGGWVATQRLVRKGLRRGVLSEERAAKLEDIGMVWQIRSDGWTRYYKAAKAYYEAHGDLRTPRTSTFNGVELGIWLINMRAERKRGRLTGTQIAALDKLGMDWDVREAQWERHFRAAERYARVHGSLDIPAGYVDENGLRLGEWLARARRAHAKGKLSRERTARLEAMGISWSATVQRWERMYRSAEAYFRAHGDLLVSQFYVDEDGLPLGNWIQENRKRFKRGVLSRERIAKLEAVGMVWQVGRGRARQARKSDGTGCGKPVSLP